MEPFKILVMSGGGVKGIAQLGCLHYFHEKGTLNLKEIHSFYATSIGSVICLLMICDYTPMDILKEIYDMDILKEAYSIDPSNFGFYHLTKGHGVMSLDKFFKRIKGYVKSKFKDENGKGYIPTFERLYQITGKYFVVTGTNISKSKVEYFSLNTYPDMKVTDAVKISCSLPIIFQKIEYNGDIYTDGGILDNFPYDQIQNKKEKVLGVIVTGTDVTSDGKSLYSYLYKLITLPINTLTELRICNANLNDNTTLVRTTINVSVVDFNLDRETQMKFFTKGYKDAECEDKKTGLFVPNWELLNKNLYIKTGLEEQNLEDGWDDFNI